MSYEHCDLHDMEATNGCPVCNAPNAISNVVRCTEFQHVEENVYDTARQQINELWSYVEDARVERDEARKECELLRQKLNNRNEHIEKMLKQSAGFSLLCECGHILEQHSHGFECEHGDCQMFRTVIKTND